MQASKRPPTDSSGLWQKQEEPFGCGCGEEVFMPLGARFLSFVSDLPWADRAGPSAPGT